MTEPPPPLLQQRTSGSNTDSVLRLTAVVFVAAFSVHGIDHLRRGLDFESTPIFVIGAIQTLLVVFAVVLVAMRNRWAALTAVVVGTINASGFILQHVLPAWFGPLSDSFVHAPPDRHVIAVSWFVVLLDILSAIAFAVAGTLVLRVRNPSDSDQIPKEEVSPA
jgi:cyanate permease